MERVPGHSTTVPSPTTRLAVGRVSLWVVLLLAALEFGLRHLGGYGQWVVTQRSARYGWTMLPNQHALSRDLSVAEDINALGFRDREWDAPLVDEQGASVADTRVFRVAFLGNSFTYGTSVAVEDTFARRLEGLIADELARRGVDRRALVMNFAVQGYRLEQMVKVYRDVVRPFRPDLVVVPCHEGDPLPLGPTYDEPDWTFRDVVVRSAIHDLLARHVIHRWIPPPRAAPRPELVALGMTQAELEAAMLAQPFAKAFEILWRRAADRMTSLQAQLALDAGHLVLVGLPRPACYFVPEARDAGSFWGPLAAPHRGAVTYIDPWPRFEREMQPFVDDLQARGFGRAGLSDLAGFTWTDPSGRPHTVRDLPSSALSLHLPDDLGHLSPRGHAIMAEEILAGLVADGLLPTNDDVPAPPAAGEAPGHAERAASDGPVDPVLALLDVDPGRPEPSILLAQRWTAMLADAREQALAEMDAVLAADPPQELVELVWYWRVQASVASGDALAVERAVDDYRRVFPHGKKVPRMLMLLAERARGRPEKALAIYRDILANHPDFERAPMIPGRMRRIEDVGETFALAFDDARSGEAFDVSALRGRIVVVHACSAADASGLAELSRLSSELAAFAPRGVSLVCIGFDEAPQGREHLLEVAARLEVDGPLWFAGGGRGDAFVRAWGIDELPVTFVLDRDGLLVDADAHGRLERVLAPLVRGTDDDADPPP